MKDQMLVAIEKDLGKSKFVTELTSLYPCLWEIQHDLTNIDEVTNGTLHMFSSPRTTQETHP